MRQPAKAATSNRVGANEDSLPKARLPFMACLLSTPPGLARCLLSSTSISSRRIPFQSSCAHLALLRLISAPHGGPCHVESCSAVRPSQHSACLVVLVMPHVRRLSLELVFFSKKQTKKDKCILMVQELFGKLCSSPWSCSSAPRSWAEPYICVDADSRARAAHLASDCEKRGLQSAGCRRSRCPRSLFSGSVRDELSQLV